MRRAILCLSGLLVLWSAMSFAQEPVVIRCPDVGTKLRISPGPTLEVVEDLSNGLCRYRNVKSGKEHTQFLDFDVTAKHIEPNLETVRSLSPLQVGKSVGFDRSGGSNHGRNGAWEYTISVEKYEMVKVPVGELATYVILQEEHSFNRGRYLRRWWYSPVVRYPVKFEYETLGGTPPTHFPSNWQLIEVKLR